MSGLYFGCWDKYEDFREEFFGEYREKPADFPAEADVLFAVYEAEGYEGSALCVYRKGDQLMEWGDGHCSCNGLEWASGGGPVTWEALAIRPRDEMPTYGCADKNARDAFWLLVDGHAAGRAS